jgi:HEAT repeat protein
MLDGMSDSRSKREENPVLAGQHRAPLGADLLPPVETPSAGFILQLFVVPALIVLAVVSIWLLFTWLVHRTSSQPEDLIQGLQGSGVARWQRASELAGMLSDKRYADFQTSASAANKLATILDREIDSATPEDGMQDEAVTLRYFLCRALGEFRVPDGIEVLLKAASTNRDPKEQSVRLGAIEAIAVRAYNLSHLQPPQPLASPELEPTLFRLASDDDPLVRSETAYALGQLGTPASLDRLEAMLDDAYTDARYNAAVALAHHGRAKAAATLAEMLDPTETTESQRAENAQARAANRTQALTSALSAAEELAQQNPDADMTPVIQALKKLTGAAKSSSTDKPNVAHQTIDLQIIAAAQNALEVLERKR